MLTRIEIDGFKHLLGRALRMQRNPSKSPLAMFSMFRANLLESSTAPSLD